MNELLKQTLYYLDSLIWIISGKSLIYSIKKLGSLEKNTIMDK